mmetsp:Transcript_24714/g.40991  ORF Transcript_24714/g.40991 Transcript_24714/m.40991 type:complete len:407 (+) Transcript_24714:34-1254(+)
MPSHNAVNRRRNALRPDDKTSGQAAHAAFLQHLSDPHIPLSVPDDVLVEHVVDMWNMLGCLSAFEIEREQMRAIVMSTCDCYHSPAYHCFQHAVDVCRAMFIQLMTMEAISQLERATLMLTALCHDAGHPGVTNSVLQASWDYSPSGIRDDVLNKEQTLSTIVKNLRDTLQAVPHDQSSKVASSPPIHGVPQSTLEEYHVALARQTLAPHLPLGNMTAAQTDELLCGMHQLVLVTDLRVHKHFMDRMEQLDELALREDRPLLLALLLKAADICNAAAPFPVFWVWSARVCEEHKAQLELVRSLPAENPAGDSVGKMPSSTGFLDVIAIPFFAKLAEVLPSCEWLLRAAHRNRYFARQHDALCVALLSRRDVTSRLQAMPPRRFSFSSVCTPCPADVVLKRRHSTAM